MFPGLGLLEVTAARFSNDSGTVAFSPAPGENLLSVFPVVASDHTPAPFIHQLISESKLVKTVLELVGKSLRVAYTWEEKRLETMDLGLCKLLSGSKVIGKFQELDISVFSKKSLSSLSISVANLGPITQPKILYLQAKLHYTNKAAMLFLPPKKMNCYFKNSISKATGRSGSQTEANDMISVTVSTTARNCTPWMADGGCSSTLEMLVACTLGQPSV